MQRMLRKLQVLQWFDLCQAVSKDRDEAFYSMEVELLYMSALSTVSVTHEEGLSTGSGV